ncbi:MAG: sigma-70 family RNA polymerase sigma factor [Acidobacteria bacterium]|nr:sigma-70 family RNA polymerase sigma factor [Acidobacteriota bacterium]MDA1236113.1 sigma-70 family RNA polymerase sigma factor [Acidobacteriota bacterium]
MTLLNLVAVRRDQDALAALYDRYSRVVYAVLLRITRDQPSAEELCQEVFFRLWKNADSFDGCQGSLTPWLLTIARNAALDRFRSKGEKQRHSEIGTEQILEAPTPGNIDVWVDNKLQADRATALMGDLPEGQRQALELAYFEGLSQTEIADKLGAPLGTVKSWVRGALLRLREQMGGVQ